MALAGVLLAAVGGLAAPGRGAAAAIMDQSCCRVPAGQACCCCEATAAPAIGAVPASPASSTRGVTPRGVGIEFVGEQAPCRCVAGEPAAPAPKSDAPLRIGRPVPTLNPAVEARGWDDLARVRRAMAASSRPAPAPISPLGPRTTPLLI